MALIRFMEIHTSMYKLTGLFLLIFFSPTVQAAFDGYRVIVGTSWYIDEHSVAKSVTNGCSYDLFVPTKTPTEWASFVAHPPACVTLGTTDPCIGTPGPGSVCQDGMIYIGTFSSVKYKTTPGGCTNSTTPTCDYTSTDPIGFRIFGAYATTIPTSTTDSVGNTSAIVTADGGVHSTAAEYCQSMVYGGYNDWVMPASSILNLMAVSRTKIVGLRLTTSYYSSTQGLDNTLVKAYDMTNGSISDRGRGFTWPVRCVRSY